MSKNKIIKVLVLLLVLGLILIQTCKVGAQSTLNELLNQAGNEITSENGDVSNNLTVNAPTTNTTPTTTNNNNQLNSANTNGNKTLPKTGTNENVIIGLMVICVLGGVYAFKKVKDYNM